MPPLRKPDRILCINCNVCVNTFRRYLVLELNTRVISLLSEWISPRIITEEDYICEPCNNLLMRSVNEQLATSCDNAQASGSSQQGRRQVCSLCGRSILNRQSHPIVIDNPSEEQIQILAVIQSRITPRQVSSYDKICHSCWMSCKRAALRTQQVDNIDLLAGKHILNLTAGKASRFRLHSKLRARDLNNSGRRKPGAPADNPETNVADTRAGKHILNLTAGKASRFRLHSKLRARDLNNSGRRKPGAPADNPETNVADTRVYKISRDHIELFFSAIRARGGFNNNPNAVQLKAAFKRLIVRAEIRDGGLGNCIPLEQINILNCSSTTNPTNTLNQLTERKAFTEIPEDDSDLYAEYIDCLNGTLSKYTQSVAFYIAGFVARKVSRSIMCETCISLLLGDPEANTKSLVKFKSKGRS
ncbi:unnamed protein product [Colias eurytheme]|nr:unnamed protein product [Colias eurytheme]